MHDFTNQRKLDHIRIVAEEPESDRNQSFFDDIQLTHRALPEIDLKEVDASCEFMNKKLSFPLLISSMTGGDHEILRTVNRNLALAAEQTGVALAVGSQRVMFTHPDSCNSFKLRPYAPTTLLFSNLGAVQFNYGFGLAECEAAIAALEADALYLHLNPLQEAVQPEGNTNFSSLLSTISDISKKLNLPIIIKEVGSGICKQDAILLKEQGINYLDIAGRGGTSWSYIEDRRQTTTHNRSLGLTFADWGLPTPQAVQACSQIDDVTLIASGGIRTGIDMVKAMILGASLCGIAAPFLKPAMESPEAVVELIEVLRKEFLTAQFLLGIQHATNLIRNKSLLQNNKSI